jgi:hypothetical protein
MELVPLLRYDTQSASDHQSSIRPVVHEAQHVVTPNFLWILVKSKCSLRSGPFCECTQCRKVVSYRRFGTTCRTHIQVSSRAVLDVCNKLSMLHNIPEERRSHLHRGEIPKSCNSTILPHFVRIIVMGYPLSSTAVAADASNAQGHSVL